MDDIADVLSWDERSKKERVERRPEVSNSHKSDLFIYKLIDFLLSPPQHNIHKYWLSLN